MTRFYLILFAVCALLWASSCDQCEYVKDGTYKTLDGTIYTIQGGLPLAFQTWTCSRSIDRCGTTANCINSDGTTQSIDIIASGDTVIMTFSPQNIRQVLIPTN